MECRVALRQGPAQERLPAVGVRVVDPSEDRGARVARDELEAQARGPPRAKVHRGHHGEDVGLVEGEEGPILPWPAPLAPRQGVGDPAEEAALGPVSDEELHAVGPTLPLVGEEVAARSRLPLGLRDFPRDDEVPEVVVEACHVDVEELPRMDLRAEGVLARMRSHDGLRAPVDIVHGLPVGHLVEDPCPTLDGEVLAQLEAGHEPRVEDQLAVLLVVDQLAAQPRKEHERPELPLKRGIERG